MTTRVMLAEKWDNQDPTGWWMSEKLDGVRAWWTGSVLLSRLGNTFPAPKWFTEALPKVPLDGELWCGRGQFKEAVSITKSSKRLDDWKYVTYLVFDAPNYDGEFEERMRFLKSVIGPTKTPHARVVGHIMCKGEKHLMKVLGEVEDYGGEGLMLRAAHSKYEFCRSKLLLKVKTFFDEEAKVIGQKKGQGRNADVMGHLICQTPDGREFHIGGGFTDAQRKHPPKIGSVVTYKYFELSAALKPRFPIFIGVRKDIDWDEYCKTYKPPTKKTPGALKKTHTIMFSDVPTVGGLEPSSVPSLAGGGEDDDDDEDDIEEYKQAVSAAAAAAATDKKKGKKSKGKGKGKGKDKEEEEEEEEEDKRVPCKYGANCYRQNPAHFKLFSHPPSVKCPYKAKKSDEKEEKEKSKKMISTEEELLKDKELSPLAVYESSSNILDDNPFDSDFKLDYDSESEPEPKPKKRKTSGDDSRPDCKYGEKCYNKNPEHLKKYKHPATTTTKYEAVLTDEKGDEFKLEEGANELGRGFGGITDQHLSRKQARLDVDGKTGKVTLTVVGSNSTFVKRAGKKSAWEKIATNGTAELKNGDKIKLIKDSTTFVLKVGAKKKQ